MKNLKKKTFPEQQKVFIKLIKFYKVNEMDGVLLMDLVKM